MQIKIEIQKENALTFETEVLVLKHADALFGVDRAIVNKIVNNYNKIYELLPEKGKHIILDSFGLIDAHKILFIGVGHLFNFRYKEIRDFARRSLNILATEAPHIKHIALTIHGVGYGLDETESFESEIAGLIDSIQNGHFPTNLEKVSIIEINAERVSRLNSILRRLLPKGEIIFDDKGFLTDIDDESSEIFREVGYTSNSKPNIFVAMPFDESMDDIYHYGIQGAVNKAGFLCERADLSSFTGDVMEWVKKRISQATFLIADLTNANPNVYLEVGYAWGLNKPTVLLVQNIDDLKFDIKGQRCLVYKKISELENKLCQELKNLKAINA